MSAKYRVLIVEDDPGMLRTLQYALERRDIEVATAMDAETAVETFSAGLPDAVLLDAVLPDASGFDVCATMRKVQGASRLPIIMVTGLDQDQAVNKAYDSGATDFLTKPVNLLVLGAKLRRIIEAYRRENELRQRRIQFDAIFRSIPDAAVFVDRSGNIILVNRACLEIFGYQEGDLEGKPKSLLWEEDQEFKAARHWVEQEEGHGEEPRQWLCRRADGSTFPADFLFSRVRDDDNQRLGRLWIIRDITDRKRREEELAARQRELLAITENAPDVIARLDKNLRYIFVNRAQVELSGVPRERFLGRTNEELGQAPHLNAIWNRYYKEVLRSGETLRTEFEYPDPEGVRFLSATIAPDEVIDGEVQSILVMVRDITDSWKDVERRTRADRLEVMGHLAGGVAHDFNNLITALSNSLSLALDQLDDDSPAAPPLQDCHTALDQAMRLSQQLLTFAKGGQPIRRLHDIAIVVRESVQFCLRATRSVAMFRISPGLWPAMIDEGQIAQVMSNLVLNADQAMPSGGVVVVKLQNAEIDEETKGGLKPGPHILLEVEDRGMGIPTENIDRIFDPYFTTKKSGRGLGLATVYSIVRKHEGAIEVDSASGRGSTFRIWLPSQPGAKIEKATPAPAKPVEKSEKAGRILILEDQEIVARGLAKLLQRMHYEVDVTTEGRSTVSHYVTARQEKRPYDIVILDLTIPGGMGGIEVIEELREIDPNVRAIVSSGYWDDPVLANASDYGFSAVLPKPYRKSELENALREVMG